MMKATVGTALVIVAFFASAAQADANNYYKFKKMECFARVTANGVTQLAARPTFIVGTTAGEKNNLRSMEVKARLVTGSGIFPGPWGSAKTYDVQADGANRKIFSVLTPWVGAGSDRKVQVKIVWDRIGKRDWVYENKLAFNKGFCPVE